MLVADRPLVTHEPDFMTERLLAASVERAGNGREARSEGRLGHTEEKAGDRDAGQIGAGSVAHEDYSLEQYRSLIDRCQLGNPPQGRRSCRTRPGSRSRKLMHSKRRGIL